ALPRAQPETAVEVCRYRKCMGCDCVIVHYMNPNAFSKGYVHDRPVATLEFTPIESNIHTLVSSDNNKIGRFSWHIRRPIPTICPKSEPVKSVSCSEQTCDDDHYYYRREN